MIEEGGGDVEGHDEGCENNDSQAAFYPKDHSLMFSHRHPLSTYIMVVTFRDSQVCHFSEPIALQFEQKGRKARNITMIKVLRLSLL